MRSKSRFTTLVLLDTRESYLQIRVQSVRFAATVARATQHSLPSERYPLLGPVFHRLDRTSLPGASLDHLVGAGEQRLARPFCAVVEPGEDTTTLSTSSNCHLRVRRFIEPSHRV
jgi:hypothetical protein